MAGQRQLKGFYVGLAAIVVVGAAGLWWARGANQGPGTRTIDPLPLPTGTFEGHVMGSDSAPVTVIEYADFECPACAQFAVLTEPEVRQRLVATGEVRWIFRDFPLDGHPYSMPAHLAAACAGEQGKFWEMHDQLYFNQGRWVAEGRPERTSREYAQALGLDMGRYDECMRSERYKPRLQATKQQGRDVGVNSTPTFVINNQIVAGALPYDEFKKLIDRALARAK
jgi:protein-disulfide isomerase